MSEEETIYRDFPSGAHVIVGGKVGPYAWPGGYPLSYYPVNEHGSGDGVLICADCVNAELADPERTQPDGTAGYISSLEEEVHDTVTCDGCNEVIAYQNWCHECQDSVDVDEDTGPHICPKDTEAAR